MKRILLVIAFLSCLAGGCTLISTPPDPLAKYKSYDQAYQAQAILEKINQGSFLAKHIENRQVDKVISETQAFYSQNDTALFWLKITEGDTLSKAQEVIEIIESSKYHGLNPEHYQLEKIKTLFQNAFHPTLDSTALEVAAKVELDILLTTALVSLGNDLDAGKIEHDWDIKARVPNDIVSLLSSKTPKEYIEEVQPNGNGYKSLVEQTRLLNKIKNEGGWQQVDEAFKYKHTATGQAVETLAKRLMQSGDLEQTTSSYDEKLEQGVKAFQARHGIKQSGMINKSTLKALNEPIEELIDKVELNLERMRWLPDMGSEYVFVNIPEYILKVISNEKTALSMRACVGKLSKPSPIFQDEMEHIVFSPIWNIPGSIAREELLDWLHYNPNLLIMNGVKVKYNGYTMNPLWIDWNSVRQNPTTYTFHQKPSKSNSMGDVKFMFPNRYSVYIHDTPHKEDFRDTKRAYSAGCIRVAKPVELAQYLLKDPGTWDEKSVKTAMNRGRQKRVNLSSKIPVYLFYLTAWVDEAGILQNRDDVYGHDKKQLKKLNPQSN